MTTPVALVLMMASAPGQAGTGAPADLLRRLDEAEARIRTLEQLVRDQSGQLRALRAGLSAQAPAAPSPPPVPAAGAQGAVEAPPERPITHQLVSLRFNGLVQAWYLAGDHGLSDTFRIRRSELLFTGEITNKARWQVMEAAGQLPEEDIRGRGPALAQRLPVEHADLLVGNGIRPGSEAGGPRPRWRPR